MRPIPLNFMTMYADLAQSIELADAEAGSISIRQIKGRAYAYVTTKDGASRRQRCLGPADDPAVEDQVRRIGRAAVRARANRTIVSTLKQKARIPAPTIAVGRVLESLSKAGLFTRGLTLVGTAAYQTYPCLLGAYLPSSAFTTNDIDLSVAAFAASDQPVDVEAILKRADPTFAPRFGLEGRLPRVFVAASGFAVEFLTKYGRGRRSPVEVKGLGVAADALSYQEYLTEESTEAVALYAAGIPVRVPTPLRFAVHKLIVARERPPSAMAKKIKDLQQAQDLLDVLLETDEDDLRDALDEARGRGRAWKTAIDASLREIGRDARHGVAPARTKGTAN